MSALTRIAAFLAAAALSPAALAAEASMDKADVVWMLVSTTLVLFMTIPGIALFYGGMARKKNVLSILAQTTVICCALTLVWFAAGYSLAFGPGSAFVGGLSHVFLNGLDINSMSGSIPTLLFVCFQMTFAILTATLMIGAFAGRMKFSAMLVFMILWSLCVYSPVCHWVWAEGGFFFDMGALDYAGGTVVHINAGVSGLVACLVLGKRLGYGREPMSPHNLTFAMLGAAILWIGWLLGLISGAVGGLVVITPASGFVGPVAALVMGLIGGVCCFWGAVFLKRMAGWDDSLDAFGVHGVGGIVGALLTGVFASSAVTGSEMNPVMTQVGIQAASVVATMVYASAVSWILLKIIDVVMGLRVTSDEERMGLDLSLHGERIE